MHSQTPDAPVFLDYNDFLLTEVVKKAVLMVQEPFEKPKGPPKQEGSKDEARAGRGRESGICPT